MNTRQRSLSAYISERSAAQLCGTQRYRIKQWAAQGLIGTRTWPNEDTKYCRADLEALMAASTTVGRPSLAEAC